jgi:hypothetical protein
VAGFLETFSQSAGNLSNKVTIADLPLLVEQEARAEIAANGWEYRGGRRWVFPIAYGIRRLADVNRRAPVSGFFRSLHPFEPGQIKNGKPHQHGERSGEHRAVSRLGPRRIGLDNPADAGRSTPFERWRSLTEGAGKARRFRRSRKRVLQFYEISRIDVVARIRGTVAARLSETKSAKF